MLCDWTQGSGDEFINCYVRPHGIRYSIGLVMRDLNNYVKCGITLDRTGYTKFSECDMQIRHHISHALNNLFKNFYVDVPNDNTDHGNSLSFDMKLTAQEKVISNLLCDGITPEHISEKLSICKATVYKHISHIHVKLGVKNRQELIVKLMRERDKGSTQLSFDKIHQRFLLKK